MSSYSSTYPAIRPTYQIDFSNGKRIPPNATFSRSDSPIDATKAAASAVHFWSNEKHLSSENLLTHSNDISSAYGKNGLTETGGQTAPDGGTDAYKLTEDSATGFHRIYYASSVLSSGSLTVSCYVKYIGRQWVYIRLRDSGASYRHVWFDVQNGTKGTEETNMTGTISASGGGYYKLTATVSSVHATSADVRIGGANADGNTQYTGSGADAFAVWGIQASTTGETVLNETSGQIHREYAPTLKSPATAGAARFEHDPETNVSLGCLIESQSSNLLLYSANFDESYWTKYRATISMNAAIAPDGDLAADLFVAEQTGSAQTHIVESASQAFTSGTAYTFSIFVKPAGFSKIRIAPANGTTWAAAADYDLSGSGSVSGVTGTASAEAVGNGWFRCSLTGTAGATASTPIYVFLDNGSGTSFDGDDYSGVLLWGAQFEQSSFASSYIATLLSARTRASDNLSVATADIGYTGGPLTIVGEVGGGYGASAIADLRNSSGSSDNYLLIWKASAAAVDSSAFAVYLRESATLQAAQNITGSGGATTVAVSMDTNNISCCADGGAVTTDTSAVIPAGLNKLWIGNSYSGFALNSNIKRIALYNEALSDTNLQALTS